MPTTVVPVTGGTFTGNDGKNILRTQFFTVDATPQVFDFEVVDPALGAIAQCFYVRVRFTAVAAASLSCGEASAAYYDNGTSCLKIGSTAIMATGAATLTIGATGRAAQFSFTGISSGSLQWTVIFEITPMAAE